MKQYTVYILASVTRRLDIGCTSNLPRRLTQHRSASNRGHTGRYRIGRLVYLETTSDPHVAVARERQLKGWLRARKVALINAGNPTWRDLAAEFGLDPANRPSGAPDRDPSLRSG